jgi:O-acetylhomoserine/O-acetylserine sulfhydrylase-like pyridoxal-dependent enzyme
VLTSTMAEVESTLSIATAARFKLSTVTVDVIIHHTTCFIKGKKTAVGSIVAVASTLYSIEC